MIKWTVTREEVQLTPLAWLQQRIPAAPESYLRKLLRGGRVLRFELPLLMEDRLVAGDHILLPESARLQQLLAAPPAVVVLCETPELLVVEKPAGLAVHASRGHEDDNLTARVETLLKARGAQYRTAPIHRLDRDTSGPVLFGKGQAAISRLGQLMMSGGIAKTYLALVRGQLPQNGSLTTPVPAKGKLKEAQSDFRLLAAHGDYSLLEITLVTGRKHQIRRQFADAGTPLAGDQRYGGVELAGLDWLFLHGSSLRITLPDAPPLCITLPLPTALAATLTRLGFAPSEIKTTRE